MIKMACGCATRHLMPLHRGILPQTRAGQRETGGTINASDEPPAAARAPAPLRAVIPPALNNRK